MTILLAAVAVFYFNQLSQARREGVRLNLDYQSLVSQSHATDRFNAAVDLLNRDGTGQLTTRVGGAYALDQVMRYDPAQEPAVVEALCAFVRAHASRPPTQPATVPSSPDDVRAAVAVLGRRPHPAAYPLDLSGALLGLDGADLHGVDLARANLSGANLAGANLHGANLSKSDMSRADLSEAELSSADLSWANLSDANLRPAQRFGAAIRDAKLDGAILNGADLRDLSMNTVYMRQASLHGADLRGAALVNVDLRGVDLHGVDLSQTAQTAVLTD